MKGDIPKAAFRLLTMLPVKTHVAPDRSGRPSGYVNPPGRGGSNAQAIKVYGTVYPSHKAVLRELRVSFDVLKRWLGNGTAEYVEAPQKERRTA